jgi:hypothetical protein
MFKGRIVAEFDAPRGHDKNAVGLAMAGSAGHERPMTSTIAQRERQ